MSKRDERVRWAKENLGATETTGRPGEFKAQAFASLNQVLRDGGYNREERRLALRRLKRKHGSSR